MKDKISVQHSFVVAAFPTYFLFVELKERKEKKKERNQMLGCLYCEAQHILHLWRTFFKSKRIHDCV